MDEEQRRGLARFAVAGAHAASIGRARDTNPYHPLSAAFSQWDAGWLEWTAQRKRELAIAAAKPSFPKFKRGQLMEILTDRLSDKAPCTCTIVGVKRTYIVVEHSDEDEYLKIERLRQCSFETSKTHTGKVLYTVKWS